MEALPNHEGIDTRAESSEIVLAVKSAIDAMEGRKIGYRTYRSLRERHKEGHSAGGRIYAYRSITDGNYKRRIVDEAEAAIVREIFERFAAGESAKAIVRDLNERRVPSPGAAWNNRVRRAAGWVNTALTGAHSKASGILRNPIYAGLHTWNKRKGRKVPGTAQRIQKRRPAEEWIEIRDESLRIVPDAIWQQVQTRIERQRHGTRTGRPNRYVLSGVLKCASCGGSYTIRNAYHYQCSSHSNGRNALCTQRRVINRRETERRPAGGPQSRVGGAGRH